MTVLRAKVAGQWIDVTGGGAAFVGPNDPGPSYSMWYDSDAPNPVDVNTARWNTAWGVQWAVSNVGAAGTNIAAGATLVVATAPAMVFLAGRRYRFRASARAVQPQSGGQWASFSWSIQNFMSGLGSFDNYAITPYGYTSIQIDAVVNGDGGTYAPTFNIVNSSTVTQPISIWLDGPTGNCYIEDVGPVTPAAVVPVVPTTIWQPLGPLLQNGWVNYGAPYGPAWYRLIGDMVQLRGLISSGTSPTAQICTLPAGYIPQYQPIFTVACNGGNAEVRIDTAGNMNTPSAGAGSSPQSWMSLTGITYPVS